MIAAVMSDTHLERATCALETVMERYCLPADVLLHCGDMVSEEVWAYLSSHPRFYAVQGNSDLLSLHGAVPVLREVDINGWRVGLAHGWGPRSQVWKAVAAQFPQADLICYGHTHIRDWRQLDHGPWILNPGSLFCPRDNRAGLALVRLEQGSAPQVEWVELKD